MNDPKSILEIKTDYKNAFDLSDTIMHTCVCGSNMWRVIVMFEDYEISSYFLDMECFSCGTRAKAPTPIDKEGYDGTY